MSIIFPIIFFKLMFIQQHKNIIISSHNSRIEKIQLNRPVTRSKITLTSPDPSAIATNKRSKRDTVESYTHEVTFIPFDDTVQSVDNELDHHTHIKSGDDSLNKSYDKERKIVDEL